MGRGNSKTRTLGKGKVNMLHRVLVEDFEGEANTHNLMKQYNTRYPSMSVTPNEIGQLLSRYPHFRMVEEGNNSNGRLAIWAAVVQ